ncbi:MAG TPA: SDR family oxidoreductase [Anaerolineaceae bacterium]
MPKVILITGCSAGIGRELARSLSAAGYAVAATARNVESLAGVPAALKLPLDVSRPESIRQAVETVQQHFGRIDVLVNNAGYAVRGAVEELPIADLQAVFDVNVLGAVRMVQAVLPGMRGQGSGRIINISSLSGLLSTPLNGAYSASKYALEALSDALRWETARFGIQVVLVEPGPIKTRFAEKAAALAQAAFSNAASPYRALYGQSLQVESSMQKGGLSPEAVAALVRRVIETGRPKARYLIAVNLPGQLVLRLGSAAWDLVVRRMYRIPDFYHS